MQVSAVYGTMVMGRSDRLRRPPNMFLSMSWELLMEFMSHLHPADLLALSRTSKAFRTILLSKKAKSLWKSALNGQGCPPCPSDLSEPTYAASLYGDPICEVCDAPGVYIYEFRLRHRLCDNCLRANLLPRNQFASTFPQYRGYVLRLIPNTYTRTDIPEPLCYLRQDIITIGDQVTQRIAAGTLRQFFVDRSEIVKAIDKTASHLQIWVNRDYQEIRDGRYQEVLSRLLSLGHAQEDIEKLCTDPLVTKYRRLTDESWLDIQKKLEAKTVEFKLIRIKESRLECLKNAYLEFENTLKSPRWMMCPRVFDLQSIPEIRAILSRDPHDASITKETFSNAFNFETIAHEWIEARKAKLMDLVKEAAENPDPLLADIASSLAFLPSTSAALVFTCDSPVCSSFSRSEIQPQEDSLMSFDSAMLHHCEVRDRGSQPRPLPTRLALSVRGVRAAVHVLDLLGLDARYTTPDDLDQLCPFFTCQESSSISECLSDDGDISALRERPVRTWREVIRVFCLSEHECKHRLLTEEELNVVKMSDPTHAPIDQWACNHCHHWARDGHEYIQLKQHISSFHNITAMMENVDYFRHPHSPFAPDIDRSSDVHI